MRFSFSYILFLVLLISSFANAQKISGGYTFAIDDQLQERIYAIDRLEFFEDTSNQLNFETVSQPGFQDKFKINPAFSKGLFNPSSTYWVKVSVLKNPQSEYYWILEFYDQTIDRITAFLPEKNTYKTIELGDRLPFEKRVFSHKNFEVPVSNQIEGIDNYYFKITSSQKADIRVAFRSVNRFVYYSLNEYFLYGIFYGMILIITLYNLLMYAAIREVKYLYYVFYLLCVVGFAMSVDGIGFQYLWPKMPSINNIAVGIFGFGIIVFAILFSIKFLNLRHRYKPMYFTLMATLILKTILFLLGVLQFRELLEIQYYDILPFALILVASIQVWKKGYKVARLFVIAYSILFLGVFLKILIQTAWVPHTTLIYYSLHIAFLIEMLLLTLALGDRIKILKESKDQALLRSLRQAEMNAKLKDKVNAELEQKVLDRTRELESKTFLLEQSNQQLIEKDQEIKRINSLLDKDIWKLKSQVKEGLKARVTNRKMDYQEFKLIFPDPNACHRYLAEIKWGKGFTCKSCGYQKE
ncbi:7TM diverse intracellular signaling domain-containing protein, partial [uncultured Algoriphagus sp.]|nr:receptor [Algoriphagus sp.]